MRHPLENIQELRWRQGIEDVELHAEIHNLRVGDGVKLTFRTATPSFAGETLMVRITSISGDTFRGKLAKDPASIGLSKLRVGSLVRFSTAHIHSIPKRQPKDEP
jgi:hypothetical protein